VLEPRSWSLRRNVFQEQLARAFDAADEVVLAAVYGAEQVAPEQRLDEERLVADLCRRGANARFVPEVGVIVAELVHATRPGDVVVVMSNGGFGGLHDRLLRALGSRAARVSGQSGG
jgi:UDP-N-acetylmuramate: L-alanyl-gamma-D-glutamyl-meso-diaminopimelate ligase